MMKRLLLLVVNVFLISVTLFAQIPAGYYDNASGKTGTTLQQALHDIISPHTSVSYTPGVWNGFKTTDVRPSPNNTKIWDMYSDIPSGTPVYEYTVSTNQCGTYSGEGSCYNREHSFPKSWFGDASPMVTDLHHIFATDGYVNNKRGNYPYGEVSSPTWTSTNGSKLGPNTYPGYTGTVFEPIDEYKGDFSRAYFYMATRYYGEDSDWPGSDMVTGSQPKPWALNMLKEWSANDPVSTKEIDRNNAIYNIQGNRNPFIDHPEYVGEVWGTTAPSITNITNSPLNPTSADVVSVSSDITDDGTISSATLKWCTDGSGFGNSINMSVSSGDTYTTDSNIPAQVNGTTVSYKIEATDNDSKTSTSSIKEYTIGTVNTPPNISNITISPSSPTSADVVSVTSNITDDGSISSASVKWCTDGSSFNNTINMTLNSGSTYKADSDIPAQVNGTTVSYKITATDNNSETSTSSINTYTIGTSSSTYETFDNFTETGSVYKDGTFTGQDGSTWTYTKCRGDKPINGATPCLAKDATAKVQSGTISGGCGTLSFDYLKAFSSDIDLEVYVNSTLVTTITSSSTNVENSGDITVNVVGDFTLKFIQVNGSSGQVCIDNISWTSYSGSGNTIETFDNCTVGASYVDDNFVGVNGITWNYIQSRDEDIYGIDGNGLILHNSSSKCYSQTITTGIGDFSVQLKKAFTGAGNRQVELFINDVSYGTSASFDDTDTHTFTVNDINISGDVVIDIRNITSFQVLIDNISWTDFTGSGGGGCASDLIISEYVEGSSGTNKYLEIYNGTSSDVDLSNYDVVLYDNGSSTVSKTIALNSITLNQGDVYVLANTESTLWSGTPDQKSGSLSFNGDDVVALRKNSTNIDVIGTIGTSTNFAADKQLQRKSTITEPTTTYNTDEWNISSDSYNDLGEHVMTCCTCPATQASSFTSSSVTSNSMTIGWTRGNGNKVLVLAHEGSAVDKDPSSGSTYTGNTVFGSGEELGTGNYVIYDGTGTSVDITGLSALTTYYFAVYEYNTSDNCYNQIELTGNETTIAVPEPTNYPTNFIVSSKTHQVIQLTWTDANTGTIPENYLIKMSDVSYADISDPADGTAEADGSTTKNITQGTESCTFSGLTESTTYYFKIYPYTNSGTDIDYKTGSEPQASETTDAAPAGGCASDLIISEYGEGSSGNSKYIEIYNGTGSSVDLSNYRLSKIVNGGSWDEATYSFKTGSLADEATLVIANNSTDVPSADEFDVGFCSWNGDDAVGLAKNSGSWSIIDKIGDEGADPGTGWDVAGTINATKDHYFIRKSSITSPQTNWSTSAGTNTTDSEWEIYSYTTGAAQSGHTMTCGPEDPPTTQASSITFSNVTTNSFTINWTNGNGDGRIVKINTSQTIADPVDGSDPTANASYSGGQQVVYNGSSNSVAVTNLTPNTQYFVKVFEKNGTGNSIAFNTTNPPENNQITPNMSSGETTIAIQDFESTPATPTLNYTTTTGAYSSIQGNSGSGDRPASTACYSSSNTSWRTQNSTVTNSFDNIDISSYQSVYIEISLGAFSIGFSTNGMEGTDYVNFEVSTDNGTSWSSEVKIIGKDNACWAFSATGNATITYDGDNTPTQYQPAGGGLRTTDGYSKIKINIPNENNQIKLRITAIDNAKNESWLVDDVKIIGTATTTTSTNTDYFRSCTNGSYNTQAIWQSSSDSTNWFNATLIPDENASSLVISDYNDISVSNDVTVNNLSLIGDGLLSMGADSHTITLQGNLNVASGATLDLSRTGTLLKCSGANAQSISGTGTLFIYNFEINKSSENVTLDRNVTINNILTLTSGNIITSSNILTIDNNAVGSVTAYSTSSYVYGNLKRKISTSGGSYDFPVGSDYYELANINFNSLTSSETPYITAFFNKTITGSAPNIIFNSTPITELLNSGFWTITPTDVSTVNYDISLTSRGQTNGGTSAGQHIHVKRSNAISAWSVSDGTHNNGDQTGTGTDPITAIKHGLTSFSDHAIGKGSNTLPIELINFKANVINNNIELIWETSSEVNNDYFTAERSKDATHFELVDIVQGNGNSNKTIKYKMIDYSPYQGVSYYRLKQTDFDGKYLYSKIVSVNNVKNYDFLIKKLFVDKDNVLHLNIVNPNNEQFNVEIFDMMGIVVLQRDCSTFDNQIILNLTTKQLSHGIYNIIIYNSKVRFNKKIIIE